MGTASVAMTGAGSGDGQERISPGTWALPVQAPEAQLEQPRPPWQPTEALPWLPSLGHPPSCQTPEASGQRATFSQAWPTCWTPRQGLQARAAPLPLLP